MNVNTRAFSKQIQAIWNTWTGQGGNPPRLALITSGLLLASTMVIQPSALAQGTLPSLEHRPGMPINTLTPVQDFSGQSTGLQPINHASPYPAPPQAVSPQPGIQPATDWRDRIHAKGAIKPVSYSPLPGIVVFPVIKHGNEKAFGDLPILFAREYAQKLEEKIPDTKIYHPVYTVDELRMQGLGHVYDQIMAYYLKAGRPEPLAMDYLLKQLSNNNRTISRVVFVEADIDNTHPDQSTSLSDYVKQWMTDGTPKQLRYFVRSRLQIFNAEKQEYPMVWSGNRSRTVKNNQFFNVTPSVFADSDSQQAFSNISRQMSRELLLTTPRAAYMEPVYDTAVSGKVIGEQPQNIPNFSEVRQSPGRITLENKEAIQRILKRQTSASP